MLAGLLEAATFFDVGVGLAWVSLLLYDARELYSYRRYTLRVAPSSGDQLVSVIIPVRDEEAQVGRCLDSVIGQTHRNLEIIVVDDESMDRTRSIVSKYQALDSRITLVPGGPLPDGWVGKNWACDQGYRVSSGSWLLFIDSDSVLAPETISSALSECAEHEVMAVSIFPEVELRGFWAKAVWPATSSIIRMLYPMRGINDPKGRSALIFGAFLLVGRTAYDLIGGHRAAKGEFVEDKQIGDSLKTSGIPYRVLMGGGMLRAGLATGLEGTWNSIRRIVSNPLRRNRTVGVGFALALFAVLVYPIIIFILLSSTALVQVLPTVVLFLAVLAPAAIVRYDVRHAPNSSYYFCLLAPVGGVMVMLAVARGVLGGARLKWRGRTYK